MTSYQPLNTDHQVPDGDANAPPFDQSNLQARNVSVGLSDLSEFHPAIFESDPHGYDNTQQSSAPAVRHPIPAFSIVLSVVTVSVFCCCDYGDCSEPLAGWTLAYVCRHLLKTLLYSWRMSRSRQSLSVSAGLLWAIALIDLSGPTVWTFGGYYIFRANPCNQGIFVYATVLWGLQSVALLLPCCFLSSIIFCAPCLLWLAPYIVRPNANTIATGREVIAKIPRLKYCINQGEVNSCPICLSDYLEDEEVMRLPCKHLFHSKCIQEWLELSQLCAICRANTIELLEKSSDPLDAV